MSFSSVLNRWLNRLYKTLAILLVVVAVAISALRLYLPYAHHHTQAFQDYLNDTYQTNITIGRLNMGWQQLGPTLIVEDVSLLEISAADVFIKKADMRINFWRSIVDRKLVTHDLMLSGVNVTYDKAAVKALDSGEEDTDLLDNITNVFLDQVARFSLNDSYVTVVNENEQQVFHIDHLNWLNQDTSHNASGRISIEGVTSNEFTLLLSLEGADRRDLQGQVYLSANELDISPWLDRYIAIENEQVTSNINFGAWLTIENGTARKMLVAFEQSDVNWLVNEKNHQFSLFASQLQIDNLNSALPVTITSTPLIFQLDEEVWQPLKLQTRISENYQAGFISQLNIAGIGKLAPLFIHDSGQVEFVQNLAPAGRLKDVYFEHKDQFALSFAFDNVNLKFSDGVPGIENLSGDAVVAGNRFHAQVQAQDTALDFDKHFIAPMPVSTLAVTLDGHLQEQLTTLRVRDINMTSPEMVFKGDVEVNLPKDGDASMSLLADISELDAKNAGHYYPHLMMGQNLVNYLNRSIIEGQLAATVLFNGPFSKFPFTDHTGIFTVDGEMTEALFQFDDDWAPIENFNANLNFTNNSMLITAREGTLTGLDVTGVEAAIAQLKGESVLTVDAQIKPSAPEHVTALMNASPLKDSVGKTLEMLAIGNQVKGEFHLNLPLGKSEGVMATGRIQLDDNTISLQAPSMHFTEVNGELTFANDVVGVETLALNWKGLPMTMRINAKSEQDYYGTTIDIDAKWRDSIWQRNVPSILHKYAHGDLDWQGQLTLYNHNDGDFSYRFDLESNLENLVSDAPGLYGKSAEEIRIFKASATGQLDHSTINANLNDELTFYGVLDHEQTQFTRSHLVIGKEQMLLPMAGFHITTQLEQADLFAWHPFISDILDAINPDSAENTTVANQEEDKPLFPKPERIRGQIDKLTFGEHQLSKASFNLLDKSNWWLLQLNAKEARTQVKFFPDWYEQGIEVNADFIHLVASKTDEEESVLLTEVEPLNEQANADESAEPEPAPVPPAPIDNQENRRIYANVPKIKFSCDSCRLGQVDFGVLNFSVGRNENKEVLLEQFIAQKGRSQMTLNGKWALTDEGSKTQLFGDLDIYDVEQEMIALGYSSIVKDSGLRLNVNANWQGGLHDFAIARVDADMSVRLDDGYLDEVSDKGVRIFSVLSLQSLVRKLTLDFRDIFSDGMFYSEITGNFNVKNGVLYSNNIEMAGAAGDLLMAGNTNLIDGELDYRLSYKPNLTSSLPVLAWIATLNPVTFLAGIAIDEVITSQVVSEFKFELTGTVDEPNMREVDRKTQDISVGRSSPPQIVEHTEAKEAEVDPKGNRTNKPVFEPDGSGA